MIHRRKMGHQTAGSADPDFGQHGAASFWALVASQGAFLGLAKSLTFTEFRNSRDHKRLQSSTQCSKMVICPPMKSAMAMPMAPVLAVPELAHFSCAALYAVSTGCVAYSKVLRTACSSSAPLSCQSNTTLTFECTMASMSKIHNNYMQSSRMQRITSRKECAPTPGMATYFPARLCSDKLHFPKPA